MLYYVWNKLYIFCHIVVSFTMLLLKKLGVMYAHGILLVFTLTPSGTVFGFEIH